MVYYSHIHLAEESPLQYLSTISDGMAQNHCEIPYSLQYQHVDKLPQHLQGILMHGRNITIYRTFHNVKGGNDKGEHACIIINGIVQNHNVRRYSLCSKLICS
jgi:hypothetical protein